MSASTKLSTSTNVRQYRALELAKDRVSLANFIRERFEERYFLPVKATPVRARNGFSILAVACLVIETLESFYEGRADTRGRSREMFKNFFDRETDLKVFGGGNDWFFRDIRCGLLHQGEARGGWRIWRSGALLDRDRNTINAETFLAALSLEIRRYSDQLIANDAVWDNFRKKMDAICVNCDPH